MQQYRDGLEAAMSEGKGDEDLMILTQNLAKGLKDYKEMAKHVRKHCTKPKAAPKSVAKEPGLSADPWRLDRSMNLEGRSIGMGELILINPKIM